MAPSVLLFTERTSCEAVWRPACEDVGLTVRALSPDELPSAIQPGAAVVIDGANEKYDEDDLLTAVGLAKALDTRAVVHLASRRNLEMVDELLEELVPGLVVWRNEDVPRASAFLARGLDAARRSRFEFVTVSPGAGELLVILGDGQSVLLPRPLSPQDNREEIVSIQLTDEARTAVIELRGGVVLKLRAEDVPRASEPPKAEANGNGASAETDFSVDGTRLGARLRKLRVDAGLTQAELARRTGIHRPNIARVEAGRHTPSLETLARLASAIGIPTVRILAED